MSNAIIVACNLLSIHHKFYHQKHSDNLQTKKRETERDRRRRKEKGIRKESEEGRRKERRSRRSASIKEAALLQTRGGRQTHGSLLLS